MDDLLPAGSAARPEEGAPALRLWLKLLGLANRIESEIRSRMRRRFGVTLPRFDLMAQLDKSPAGLTMSALGESMMVTNGNVTGIAQRLVAEGLVERRTQPGDRRAVLLRLTPAGKAAFAIMAAVHREWIEELFAEFGREERDHLAALLSKLKQSATRHPEEPGS